MDLKIPGLSEALKNAGELSAKMDALNANVETVIALLEQQNLLLVKGL